MVNYNHPEEKMLETLASYLPYIMILACIFMFLYYMGGAFWSRDSPVNAARTVGMYKVVPITKHGLVASQIV